MALTAGTHLGPYEILASIGAGGMGEVYRARDSRLDRDVAIKVLPDHLANDPTALIRFKHEAKAVAALAHPNILILYDVGLSDGTRYVVTELLEGQTLRERLSRGRLPWRKAAELGAAVADGLAAAHSKEIVHRDVKPGNIFLTDDGRVKILDFGLARWQTKPTQQDSTVTLAETEAGSVVGTVGYMSPEQVRGEKAGASSDIFSLGIVLYEMVAGRRPFSCNSAAETMSAILNQEPPAIADSSAQAPPEVERIVERCLAKNTGERFHSARDLGFALRGLFALPSRRSVSRRLWVAVAALMALIVGGSGLMYWRPGGAKSIESLAVLPFANMSGSPDADYLSDGLTDSLIDSLTELPSLKVMSHNAVIRYKGKDSDARAIGRELGVRAVLTGRITQRGDNLAVSAELVEVDDNRALWGAQYNRKLADALAVQNEIAGQITAKLRLRLTDQQKTRLVKRQTDNPEGYQLYLKGRYYVAQFTQGGLDRGLAYFHQAIAADPNYALAYGGLSYYYALLDEFYADPSNVRPKAREAAQKGMPTRTWPALWCSSMTGTGQNVNSNAPWSLNQTTRSPTNGMAGSSQRRVDSTKGFEKCDALRTWTRFPSKSTPCWAGTSTLPAGTTRQQPNCTSAWNSTLAFGLVICIWAGCMKSRGASTMR